MNKIIVNFTVVPAKAKCTVCQVEIEIPVQTKISETLKVVKEFEDKHKTCVVGK